MLEMLPGLTRIYEEWAEQYPDVQPLTIQFPPREKTSEDKGGLDGILAYPLEGHWLLVTFGLTELGEKTSEEPRVSGSGFEFTCRIPRGPEETAVPAWILRVLHAVAEHFLAGTDLDVGHWILTSSPLGGEATNGDMTSLVIVPDVDIPHITTPNGIVLFFQLVGLMSGEGEDVQRAGTSAPLVAVLRDRDPRLVSDPPLEAVRLCLPCDPLDREARGTLPGRSRIGRLRDVPECGKLYASKLPVLAQHFFDRICHGRLLGEGDPGVGIVLLKLHGLDGGHLHREIELPTFPTAAGQVVEASQVVEDFGHVQAGLL